MGSASLRMRAAQAVAAVSALVILVVIVPATAANSQPAAYAYSTATLMVTTTDPGDAQVQVWRANQLCKGYSLLKVWTIKEPANLGFGVNDRIYGYMRLYHNEHSICMVNLGSARDIGRVRWRVAYATHGDGPNAPISVRAGYYRHLAGPVKLYAKQVVTYRLYASVHSRTVTLDSGDRVLLQAERSVEISV